jgi:hypothetical protein
VSLGRIGGIAAGPIPLSMLKRLGVISSVVLCSPLQAQGLLHPRVDASIGPHAIHATYAGTGAATSSSGGMNTLAGASAGIGIGHQVVFDVEYRSAFGGVWDFSILSFGLTIRRLRDRGLYGRFAIARLQGNEEIQCTATFGCPGTHGHQRGGLSATFGVDWPLARHAAFGPMVWIARTGGKLPRYRTIGAGLHLAAF